MKAMESHNEVVSRAMQRRHSSRESAKQTDYASMNSGKAGKPRTSLEAGEARLFQQETEEFLKNIAQARA
jgi:hypothetical protein